MSVRSLLCELKPRTSSRSATKISQSCIGGAQKVLYLSTRQRCVSHSLRKWHNRSPKGLWGDLPMCRRTRSRGHLLCPRGGNVCRPRMSVGQNVMRITFCTDSCFSGHDMEPAAPGKRCDQGRRFGLARSGMGHGRMRIQVHTSCLW